MKATTQTCMIALIFLMVAVILQGCKEDEEDNLVCERRCLSEYQAEVAGCENRFTSCMQDCTHEYFDDCTWDCEDVLMRCDTSYYICALGCSCLEGLTDCAYGCNLTDTDFSCATNCKNSYLKCADNKSPYNCASMCMGSTIMCEWDCEDAAEMTNDVDAYLSCREVCTQQESECMDECLATDGEMPALPTY